MTRDLFASLTLRVLLDNGIEPTRAVTIAAVLETKIFDPVFVPEPGFMPSRSQVAAACFAPVV